MKINKRTFLIMAMLAMAGAGRVAFAKGEAKRAPASEANSQTDPVKVSTAVLIAPPTDYRTLGKLPFDAGEKLTFVIKYEFVVAGTATLEVSSGAPVNGRETLQLLSTAESNSFIDVFFKVRDFNASLVDRKSLSSLSFHQNLREGHYRVIRNTRKNYLTNTYEYERIYKGEKKTRTGPITQASSDILSSFFYVRTLPLELGGHYEIPVFSDAEIYSLGVDVDSKLYEIKVPAGTFQCYRLEPKVIGDAIFKKKGKMWVFVTADDRRIPVLIRSKALIGAFDAELAKIEIPS